MSVADIATDVMAYAKEHYSDGTGWDEIVECFNVAELAERWDYCGYTPRTVKGAIAWQAKANRVRKAYADEIRAEAF